ncbi:hypothetical protein BKP35_02715 [Anaerobacillus arseniciselenatis]|uniref:Uncharacterized protein n=1 Tax=Anaerobacillus arseniciselenatis TaxID=85682 RepID=A0A1S2LX29_9BACI|nr:hypothetical protein [Anaerobacillus arseniciselenatis]OIJ15915.1 hypothetical protein BKP35_02715 [Anaerobacillus arseniciselenatis]
MDHLIIFIIIAVVIVIILSICQLVVSFKIIHRLKMQKNTETGGSRNENDLSRQYLKEEVITAVFLKMFTIRNAVHKQTTNLHVKSIENTPTTIGISDDLLQKAFSKNNVEQINLYFHTYNNYRQKYWVNKHHKLRTVFPGDIAQKSGDVGKMMVASEQLVKQLDKMLTEIQKEEKMTNTPISYT